MLLIFGWVVSGTVGLAQTATLTHDATPAESAQLRAEAVRLMEGADKVSTPVAWPSNEQTIHFRLGNPEPGQPFEGDYISSSGGSKMRRQEWRYGTYEQVQVRNGNAFTTIHVQGRSPGFLAIIPQLTPAWLGHFDDQDIIRSITDSADGNRCIQFDSVFGDSRQSSEVCVDARNGWLVSIRQDHKIIRNSQYFKFNNAFLPGHVEQWQGDALVISLDQSIVLKDFSPDIFGVPNMAKGCSGSTPPYPIHTPQPENQSLSTNVYDVTLTGLIGGDGRPKDMKPVDNIRRI